MIWGAIKLFGIAKSAGLLVAILVIAAVAYGSWYMHVFNKGVNYTIAKIAANDAKLVARAQKARGVLLECQNLDKTWDQSTGECK